MITLRYANALSVQVGQHGVDPALLSPQGELAQAAAAHTRTLNARFGQGPERWRALPFDPLKGEHLRTVRQLAEDCRGKYHTLVVLGIGGSALGATALQAALNPPTYNLVSGQVREGRPRLFVLDNADPLLIDHVLRFSQDQEGGLQGTLWNVVTKSGETLETAAQFALIRDRLRAALGAGYAANIIATTDPKSGTMRQLCGSEGYRTLPIPEGVGGRFSVLSPVGLFPAAMCGIDIESLLDGAAAMDLACRGEDLAHNPAAMLACLLVELGTNLGKPNHVLMPYANALDPLADWYRQLWAESLGKRFDVHGQTVMSGFTPIKALGATDQHSQVQLYRDGPNDKVIGFVRVEHTDKRHDPVLPERIDLEPLTYLQGLRFSQILAAEQRATEFALVESMRPNYTLTLPALNARSVGQFIALWQLTTAYAGLLLDINAYDQPAVELGKQASLGLLGRPGYEHIRPQIEQVLDEEAGRAFTIVPQANS